MKAVEQIEDEIRRWIQDNHPEVYIVEIKLKLSRNSVLSVLVDTDEGITIDKCAKISRELGRLLEGEEEEEDAIDRAYKLEVSSPGVSYPLKSPRQFRKNIGRTLKIRLQDEALLTGRLARVEEDSIFILPVLQKKTKKNPRPTIMAGEETKISLIDIKEAKVEISFN